MKAKDRLILGWVLLALGIMLAMRFWPGPVATPAKAASRPPGMAVSDSSRHHAGASVPGETSAAGRDIGIAESALNASGLVSIDPKYIAPFRLPLLAPNRRELNPIAVVVLDLSQGESATIATLLTGAEHSLYEELAARAKVSAIKDGVQIAYQLEPEELRAREQELRTRIAAALDDTSQLYLQKIAEGALLFSLFSVPLDDITVTVTRNDRGDYRGEMTGRAPNGGKATTYWEGKADSVIAQFYGAQARTHIPQFDDDLAALAASRRGGAKSAR